MKKIILSIVALLLLGIFAYTMFYLYNDSKKEIIEYNVETPFESDIIKKTVSTGSVIPRKEILIKPVLSGIIQNVYVEAGQQIKAGDPIAKIKIIPDMLNLNNAENRVNRAKIEIENATTNFNRNKALLEKGVISNTDFQPFEIAIKNANEELESSKDALQLIKEGVSKNSNNATNTIIKSTISGTVLDVPVKEGNSVIESNNFNEGTTIASVADMASLIFKGKVDESEVGKIKEGMDLILTIGAIENQTFNAILEYVSPKGVEENGAIQFEIRANVKLRNDQFIRAGYSANAEVVLARKDKVLAINESLLQYSGDTAYVEVEKTPQIFEKRNIKLGLSDGIKVEVLEGLKKDDKIKAWNQPIAEEEEQK
jgi:HlyD family secretion protein